MKRKVAIYARVSTEHEAQISALGNQIQYYDEILKTHQDWQLIARYIDEGITGTSTRKRPNFMRMINDAEKGHFDLIVTREVSRFARNTVDALQEIRKLKKIGVEVYFTEDNIWTFNDDDGELKLTLMATLAQNESKKLSQRIKAGQTITFQNGVFYGNGNILGYDRVGKNAVINEEQAEIVRYIYSEFLKGKGTTEIATSLEKQGALTSTGLERWSAAYIARVLRNPFYSGTVIYRKQYIPDYLEQKHKTNYGEVEKIIAEGKHEPIISKDDFKKVQEIMDSHTRQIKLGRKRGIGVAKNIWSKKLECECGSHFNKCVYHRNKNNITYSYICHNRKSHPKGRIYNDGHIPCDMKELQEWKLRLMVETIFRNISRDANNKNEIKRILMVGIKIDEKLEEKIKKRIKILSDLIETENAKLDKVLDLYLINQVSTSIYDRYQKRTSNKIEKYKIEINELERKLETLEVPEVRLEKAKQSIKKILDFDYNGVNDQIIEEIVEKVIVHKDYFEWKLNFMTDTIKLQIIGKNKADCYVADYEKK